MGLDEVAAHGEKIVFSWKREKKASKNFLSAAFDKFTFSILAKREADMKDSEKEWLNKTLTFYRRISASFNRRDISWINIKIPSFSLYISFATAVEIFLSSVSSDGC